MKYSADQASLPAPLVAPCAGAWIEIIRQDGQINEEEVAPCAGAWIEIRWRRSSWLPRGSPPARGRGLKLASKGDEFNWVQGRPLRGGVD